MPIQVSRPGELTCEHAAGYGTPINRIRSTFFAFRRAEKIIMLRAVRTYYVKESHLISSIILQKQLSNTTVYKVHTYIDTIKCYGAKLLMTITISAVIKRNSLYTFIHMYICYGDKCIDI